MLHYCSESDKGVRVKKLLLTIFLMISIVFPVFGAERIKIAVLNLEKKTTIDAVALSEVLRTELSRKKNIFQLIERERLEKVLQEQKLTMAGITEEQAVRVGEILDAKLLLTGSVSYVDGRYILSVRALDSSTSEVAWADTVMSYEASGLVDLMPTLAHRLSVLAQGRSVSPFKLKPIKTTANKKNSGPSYFSRLMAPPTRRFAWELATSYGWFPGFSDSGIFSLEAGFHAPGEGFLEVGVRGEIGLGSLNDATGIMRFSLTPTIMMSLVRTRIFQAGAGILYTLSADRLAQGFLSGNKLWFTQGNIGIFAEAGLLFGRNWSLNLGWQYSLPLASGINNSALTSGVEDSMGITQIKAAGGLKYHSINLRLYLYH